MAALYHRLGLWIGRRARLVALLWAALLCLAALSARKAPGLLDASSRKLPGTDSGEVDEILSKEFANPFASNLALVFSSESGSVDSVPFQKAASALGRRLEAEGGVAKVLVPDSRFGARFRSADLRSTALLIGLGSASLSEVQKRVPGLRARIAAFLSQEPALAGWRWKLTGSAAVVYDLNLFNAADSTRAELRALPLTLLILLVVFGSLVASALPLALGLASSLLALSLLPLLKGLGPMNMLYQNMVSLLGLALGVDYALFLLSRYRQCRARLAPDEALAETLATTGVAVSYSGFTVLIGLGGLLLTPLYELRSMGFGGMAVVAAGLLLSLTLLPAALKLSDPWLGSPKALSRFLEWKGSEERWRAWSRLIAGAPLSCLCLGSALLLLLSSPALGIRLGFPDTPWLPKSMESVQGIAWLRAMGQSQELTPVNIVVSREGGGRLFPDTLDDMFRLSGRLKRDPRVARVFGPVDLRGDLQDFQYRLLYANLEAGLRLHPELKGLVLSKALDKALMQVVLKDGTGYLAAQDFVRSLKGLKEGGLQAKLGGHWVFTNDYEAALRASYPGVLWGVLAVTALVLLLAFRSFLMPLKALLLNALSVSAAFGAVVAVFQWGWGGAWLGLDGPSGRVPLEIPIIIFCITFGLSMDYEVLLLSRVREAFLLRRDTAASVSDGLAATGGLISGAAAIMVAVFGAFALADVLLVKMLGFGLAVAVAADALIVRAMMVPAAMTLMGRWNWYPGIKED